MTIMDSMSDSELDARDGHKLFKQNDGKYHSGKWETRDMLRWILYHFFYSQGNRLENIGESTECGPLYDSYWLSYDIKWVFLTPWAEPNSLRDFSVGEPDRDSSRSYLFESFIQDQN